MPDRVVYGYVDYSDYRRVVDAGDHAEMWERLIFMLGIPTTFELRLRIDSQTGEVTGERSHSDPETSLSGLTNYALSRER